MDLETQRAVEESVRHWGRILMRYPGEAPSEEQCALCKKYPAEIIDLPDRRRKGCTDMDNNPCPIMERTGVDGCKKTPWLSANKAYVRAMVHGKGIYTYAQEKAIQRELGWIKSFLLTLRPITYV